MNVFLNLGFVSNFIKWSLTKTKVILDQKPWGSGELFINNFYKIPQ